MNVLLARIVRQKLGLKKYKGREKILILLDVVLIQLSMTVNKGTISMSLSVVVLSYLNSFKPDVHPQWQVVPPAHPLAPMEASSA